MLCAVLRTVDAVLAPRLLCRREYTRHAASVLQADAADYAKMIALPDEVSQAVGSTGRWNLPCFDNIIDRTDRAPGEGAPVAG